MRQFKLKKEKSFIKILKEPPNKKKKVNWSRRFYLLIFIVIALLFVKRIYNANMIIFALKFSIFELKKGARYVQEILFLVIRSWGMS